MKVHNKIKNNLWHKIPCVCKKEDHLKFPLVDCKHCRFLKCEKSIPKDDFIIYEHEMKRDKPTGKKIKRKITEVTLVHGNQYEDVIGWKF
jgi:hypothetical protein|tara:strand:- start:662 stop:931 length:270 start_codon:yes stop_codon:yes gene_type:complete